MARNGFKIFDADTHVRPDADLLQPYLDVDMRAKLKQFDRYKATNKGGAVTYLMGTRHYQRRLGASAEDAPENKEYMSGYKRHQHGKPDPLCERDPAVRLKDMDSEGIDVNLMLPSGWFGAWTTIDDVNLEAAIYQAYHRWMADYCSASPAVSRVLSSSRPETSKHRWLNCTAARRSRSRWRSSFMLRISFPL